jgi:hypothetical protein
MDETKPDYCLKGEDFIPFVGIKKHIERNNYQVLKEGPDSKYFINTFGREILLGIYNSAIVIGGVVGLEVLAELLSK